MARRPLTLALIIGLGLGAVAGGAAQGATGAKAAFALDSLPGTSRLDLVVLPPSVGGSLLYRLAADGPWLPFAAALDLTAAPGEERAYTIETRQGSEGAVTSRRVVIDKKPPQTPTLDPATGLYRTVVELRMQSRDGSRLRYAIQGASSGPVGTADYDPRNPPRLEAPLNGVTTKLVMAWTVDEAGNTSATVSRTYRLALPGLDYAPPPADAAPVAPVPDELADLGIPKLDATPGSVLISFPAPEAGQIVAAVNPKANPPEEGAWRPMEVSGGRARLSLSCPRGWRGALTVHVGLKTPEGLRYRPLPLRVELADIPTAARPEAPLIVQGNGGSPAFLVFRPYDGEIFYSLSGQDSLPWTGPAALPARADGLSLSWYGISSSGLASEISSEFLPRLSSGAVAGTTAGLAGIADGGLANAVVRLAPVGGTSLRCEVGRDGKAPLEPTAASPLVGEGLSLDAGNGEEVAYIVRYRGFGGEGSLVPVDEGGILRFTIDRKAPEVPAPREPAPAYTSGPIAITLSSPGAEVFASVSGGNSSGEASKVDGPITLAGSASGAVEYTVRAWAVDPAGNRSAEMKPLKVVVDIATLYVAASPAGEAGLEEQAAGDGSRDRPFASLDSALSAAASPDARRSTICVRGEVSLSGTSVLSNMSIAIKGGFDADWNPVPGAKATIVASKPKGEKEPFIALAGAGLVLQGLMLRLDSGDSSTFIRADDSTMNLSEIGLSARSAGDFLAFDLDSTRLAIEGCELLVEEAQSATLLSASGGAITIRDSLVSGRAGVKYYGAASLEGGGLSIQGSRLESRASLGTRLLSFDGASIQADRSIFDVSGGPGFLVVGSFSNANGVISNSHVRVAWKGGASLFRFTGGGPAFVHDSVYASTVKGKLRFFDSDGRVPSLRNSIFACQAEGGEFVVARGALQPGDLVADCLWGFQTFVNAAGASFDLGGLNTLNAKIKPAKPCVAEDPARTWVSLPSADPSFALRSDSSCVDGAVPLEGFGRDYSGKTRPGPGAQPKPDIGADELAR